MEFFISIMDGSRKHLKFYKSGALPLLLDILIELLCITAEQVSQWDDNLEEYVAHEDRALGNNISVRNTAKCLVDSVSLILGRLNTCEYLISTILPKFFESCKQESSRWK